MFRCFLWFLQYIIIGLFWLYSCVGICICCVEFYKLICRACHVCCILFLLFVDLDTTIERGAIGRSMQQTIPGVLSAVSGSWSNPCRMMSADRSLSHRMHVFRMRLLHFVNSLHDYVMTRVYVIVWSTECCGMYWMIVQLIQMLAVLLIQSVKLECYLFVN